MCASSWSSHKGFVWMKSSILQHQATAKEPNKAVSSPQASVDIISTLALKLEELKRVEFELAIGGCCHCYIWQWTI